MPTPLEALTVHLQDNDWKYELAEGTKLVHTGFKTESSNFRVAIIINDDDDLIEVITLIPNRVPADRRRAVAELCARANFGIKLGRLDFDLTDGELRCYAGAPFAPRHPAGSGHTTMHLGQSAYG